MVRKTARDCRKKVARRREEVVVDLVRALAVYDDFVAGNVLGAPACTHLAGRRARLEVYRIGAYVLRRTLCALWVAIIVVRF